MWVGHQGNSTVIFAPFVNMNCFEGLLCRKHSKKRDTEKNCRKRLKLIGIVRIVQLSIKHEYIHPSQPLHLRSL